MHTANSLPRDSKSWPIRPLPPRAAIPGPCHHTYLQERDSGPIKETASEPFLTWLLPCLFLGIIQTLVVQTTPPLWMGYNWPLLPWAKLRSLHYICLLHFYFYMYLLQLDIKPFEDRHRVLFLLYVHCLIQSLAQSMSSVNAWMDEPVNQLKIS